MEYFIRICAMNVKIIINNENTINYLYGIYSCGVISTAYAFFGWQKTDGGTAVCGVIRRRKAV